MFSDTIKTEPAAEPVDLARLKSHLRIVGTDEDPLLTELISLARREVEILTGRALITQTRTLRIDYFPHSDRFWIEKAPVQSIESIQYYDQNDQLQTFSASNYYVDTDSTPARVQLKVGSTFPTTYDRPNAVQVEYISGYGDAGTDVPPALRHAILLVAGHYYSNREDSIAGPGANIRALPKGVDYLCFPYKVYK